MKLQDRIGLGLLSTAAVLTLWAGGSGASPRLRGFTEAPLQAEITEDDPRWDCRTMGNHICGQAIYFQRGDELVAYEVSDGLRPGCFVDPASTAEGYVVRYYPQLSDRNAMAEGKDFGFEVPCPNDNRRR